MSERTIVSDSGDGIIRYSDGSLSVDGVEYCGECSHAEVEDGSAFVKFPDDPNDDRGIYCRPSGGFILPVPEGNVEGQGQDGQAEESDLT